MCAMFNRLKESAKITDQDPTFHARYIGSLETFVASGKGCTAVPVQKLWDGAEEEKYLKRITVRINSHGIYIKFTDKKKDEGKLYDIENISFCNVDSAVNDRIFSFIYRESDSSPLECHAIVCSNTEKAKSMAIVLSRAFQIAYKEWKTKQTKEGREIAKSERSASIAKMALNRKDSNNQTDAYSETASSSGSEPGPSGASNDAPSSSELGTSCTSGIADMGVQVDFDKVATNF